MLPGRPWTSAGTIPRPSGACSAGEDRFAGERVYLQRRAMEQDFGWSGSAQAYLAMYESVC